MGGLGDSSNRPKGDNAWDYIRILPSIAEHLWMKPVEGNIYECVFLRSLPSLAVSNSDDPPGSFYSKDLFLKHKTIPNAWKHLYRLDDRLTLTNGEKVLPLPMEGRIRQDPLIREAVVFGAGKSIPGLLVFRNKGSEGMSNEAFIAAIWPTISSANAHAESFSQISKETIVAMPTATEYPKTDKESIKRLQIYRAFTKDIDAMYEKLQYTGIGTLQLDIPSLERYLIETFRNNIGMSLSSNTDDFFAAGVTSLQAIQMRGLILKHLDLGGNAKKLGPNVVFDNGDISRLARYLYTLRTNEKIEKNDEDEIARMKTMVRRYSTFKQHILGPHRASEGHVVVRFPHIPHLITY